MKIKIVKISDIMPYENNPRINEAAVLPVANSIREFGFKQPIVVDKHNVIIAGHTRYKAAILLGQEKVPCVVASDLTEDQIKAYRIADNKTGELAEWDFTILDMELATIELDMSQFGLELKLLEEEPPEPEAIEPAEVEAHLMKCLQDVELLAVQFSGGKDSVAVLNWVKTVNSTLNKEMIALFIETGAEYPCVTAHVIDVCKRMNVPLKILNPRRHILQHYAEKKVFPNVLFRECMHEFIHETTDIYLVGQQKSFALIRGGRKDQQTKNSKSRTVTEKAYKGTTFNIIAPYYALSKEQYEAELEKVRDFMWSGYEKGFIRTACWMCPFQTDQQFEALKNNYPVLWDKMKEYINEWEFTEVKGCAYRKRLNKHKVK
jgi:site-specific DNA-methyltransferase (adenine-specific)